MQVQQSGPGSSSCPSDASSRMRGADLSIRVYVADQLVPALSSNPADRPASPGATRIREPAARHTARAPRPLNRLTHRHDPRKAPVVITDDESGRDASGPPEPGYGWQHIVYDGCYALAAIRDTLLRVFGESGEDHDGRMDGESALFALTVTDEGRLLLDSPVGSGLITAGHLLRFTAELAEAWGVSVALDSAEVRIRSVPVRPGPRVRRRRPAGLPARGAGAARSYRPRRSRVRPRGYGEQPRASWWYCSQAGSSPHVRGAVQVCSAASPAAARRGGIGAHVPAARGRVRPGTPGTGSGHRHGGPSARSASGGTHPLRPPPHPVDPERTDPAFRRPVVHPPDHGLRPGRSPRRAQAGTAGPTWRKGKSSTLWHNGATHGASAIAVAHDDGRWLLLHRLHSNGARTDRMAVKEFEASGPSGPGA